MPEKPKFYNLRKAYRFFKFKDFETLFGAHLEEDVDVVDMVTTAIVKKHGAKLDEENSVFNNKVEVKHHVKASDVIQNPIRLVTKVDEYKVLAEKGNADAQYNLGELYVKGQGVTKDEKQAFYWWEKAAKQGHALSQFNLGYLYVNGKGVTQDYEQAFYWNDMAALQGHAKAQANAQYGGVYHMTQDFKWNLQSAAEGNDEAQYNLALAYANGEGVTQDDNQAVNWFEKAAAQGHTDAKFALGGMYYYGAGVAKDYEQSFNWNLQAATEGHTEAQSNIGRMYYTGEGVTLDYK